MMYSMRDRINCGKLKLEESLPLTEQNASLLENKIKRQKFKKEVILVNSKE